VPELSKLGLKPDPIGESINYDDLPQFGGFQPPLPPGAYRFQLPASLKEVWEAFDTQQGQRISAVFEGESALTIVQAGVKTLIDTAFRYRLSNAERERGRDKTLASDMDYLLAALGEKTSPGVGRNHAYIQRLLQYAGRTFGADIEWSWSCNPKRDIWVELAEGGQQEVSGTKGCGKRYYMRDPGILALKAEAGEYPLRITCECGASVRAFANLTNFRP